MGISIDADGDLTTNKTITSTSTVTGAPVVSSSGGLSAGSGPVSGGSGSFTGNISTSGGNISATVGTVSAVHGAFSGQVNVTNNVYANALIGSPGQLLGFSSYVTDGGGAHYQMVAVGDPNLGSTIWMRTYHLPGVWAGWNFFTQGTEFQFRGNGTGYSNSGWTTYSDRRVKTNLVKIGSALEKVSKLTGYTYDRTDSKNFDGTPFKSVGLIAQDVEQVLPDSVLQDPATEDNPEPTRSLNYDGVVALLVNAVNELQEEVKALQTSVRLLQDEVEELKNN